MKIISQFINFVARQRIYVVLLFCVIFALDCFFVAKAKFNENIYDILPNNDEIINVHIYAGKKFNKANTLFFSVANNGDFTNDAVAKFSENLAKIEGIKRTNAILSKDFDIRSMLEFLPYIFDADVEKSLAKNLSEDVISSRLQSLKKGILQNNYFDKFALKNDPLNIYGAFSEKLKKSLFYKGVVVENAMMFSPDKHAILVIAVGNFDCADSAKSTKLISDIEKLIASMKTRYPKFEIAYAGGYRVSAENARIAKADSTFCLLLTVVAMSIICWVSFRNRIFWLFAVLPSFVGSAMAFCFVCSGFGDVSSISIAFASIAIGVSIDYAIHILCFVDKRSGIFELADAVSCVKAYARPIFIVSGTTSIAFLLMCFFGSEGFVQLGLFGFVGIIVSAFLSVCVLPAMLVKYNLKPQTKQNVVEKFSVIVGKFASSKIALVVAIVISIFASVFVCDVRFNGDVSSFNILGENAKSDSEQIKKTWASATTAKSVVLQSNSLNSLLEENEKLKKLLEKKVSLEKFGVQNLLVSETSANDNLNRWQAFLQKTDIEKVLQKACEKSGIKYTQLRKNLEWIFNVEKFSVEKFACSPIAKMFAEVLYVGDDGCALVSSFSTDENFNAKEFQRELSREFQNAYLIDQSYLGKHIADVSFAWLWKFASIAFVFVGGYLWLTLKNLKAVFGVLLPVVLGLFWCFGLLGFFGVQINIINSVFVIFAVCLAQDYAVFVLTGSENRQTLVSVFSPILLSACTTILAFGVLCVSVHPVIYSLGAVSAISIFSIFCAVICVSAHISKWIVKNGN